MQDTKSIIVISELSCMQSMEVFHLSSEKDKKDAKEEERDEPVFGNVSVE